MDRGYRRGAEVRSRGLSCRLPLLHSLRQDFAPPHLAVMDYETDPEARLPVFNRDVPTEIGRTPPPSANATKHGLTAKKYLPAALDAVRLGHYRHRFREEYQPVTPTELLLVDELARHAAMLEFAQEAEGAVLRHGARQLVPFVMQVGTDQNEQDDATLSAAVATETLERFSRYRRAHERAFFTALTQLKEIGAARECALRPADDVSLARFRTEASCELQLRRQFESTDWRCPHCGNSGGYWLARRRRWECGGCHSQIGLRTGTVMEGSPLPLTTWCTAILHVLADPGIDAASLGQRIGVGRLRTVRGMIRSIRRAVASDGHGIPRALRDRGIIT